MPKQQRRTFTTEFKKQMVQLYENGKPRGAIVDIFLKNRKVYSTREIKVKLQERGIIVSRSHQTINLEECIALNTNPSYQIFSDKREDV